MPAPLARTPIKRPARPKEIAPAYAFPASPRCSIHVTGEIPPMIRSTDPWRIP